MKAYNRFAYLYDELMSDFDYENWYRYIKGILHDMINRQGDSEMACGTGIYLIILQKMGTSYLF